MITIVIPTIREEKYHDFIEAWTPLFQKHSVNLVTIWDGDEPHVEATIAGLPMNGTVESIMGEYADLIYNKNDGVRNLGFAFVAKMLPKTKYIITLDDDVKPIADTIQDHIKALNKHAPISWLSTASEYMRGFPYGIRKEAEVMLSHGVWRGVRDYDAATQLTQGNKPADFYRGPIPKGVMYPMCGMNLAFKRDLLPYMYFAPMGHKVGLDRFGDIWAGIEVKKVMDEKGWAVLSGYAEVFHERASNVFTNLEKEAKGIGLNEPDKYGVGEYFDMYTEKRARWKEFIEGCL